MKKISFFLEKVQMTLSRPYKDTVLSNKLDGLALELCWPFWLWVNLLNDYDSHSETALITKLFYLWCWILSKLIIPTRQLNMISWNFTVVIYHFLCSMVQCFTNKNLIHKLFVKIKLLLAEAEKSQNTAFSHLWQSKINKVMWT